MNCNYDKVKVWIAYCTLLSNAVYATVGPFLPIELIQGKSISSWWLGPIFAAYSIAVIVVSPFMTRILVLGYANVIALGMAGMGMSLISFSLIMFSDNEKTIVSLVILTRILQGTASAFIQTTCWVIATNDYPHDKEQIVGLIEATTGAGMLLGSGIGSALHAVTNFQTTFAILGPATLVAAIGVKLGFRLGTRVSPGTADTNDEEVENGNSSPPSDQGSMHHEGSTAGLRESVSYSSLLKSPRFAFTVIGSAICYFMYTFLEPILAQRLLDFSLTPAQIGLFFALFVICYIPASLAVQFIPRWVEKRLTICSAELASSLLLLLVGPSTILPDSVILIGLGWSLLGVSLAVFMVPILPELVESALPLYSVELHGRVNTLSSSLHNSFIGAGQVLALLYGSTVYSWVGFRLTTDTAAVIGLTFSVIYFVFANVHEAFRNTFHSS